MSNLNQFLSGVHSRSPTSIVQLNSTTGYAPNATISIASGNGLNLRVEAKEILSGALTAATLATALSLTGGGIISYLSIFAVDATARTLRLQLVIDGATVFDSTSASNVTADKGALIIGSQTSSGWATEHDTPFNSSLVVKIASSLTETDKIGIGVKYRLV